MTNTAQIEEHVRTTAIAVAGALGFTAAQMLGASRRHDLVEARHIAIWLAHRNIGASLSAIGRALDLHHRSVQHAIDRISVRVVDDAEARAILEGFVGLLGQAPAHVRAEIEQLDRVRRGKHQESAFSFLALLKARQEAKAAATRERQLASAIAKAERAKRVRDAKREAAVPFYEAETARVRSRGHLIRQNDRFGEAMRRALAEEQAA